MENDLGMQDVGCQSMWQPILVPVIARQHNIVMIPVGPDDGTYWIGVSATVHEETGFNVPNVQAKNHILIRACMFISDIFNHILYFAALTVALQDDNSLPIKCSGVSFIGVRKEAVQFLLLCIETMRIQLWDIHIQSDEFYLL